MKKALLFIIISILALSAPTCAEEVFTQEATALETLSAMSIEELLELQRQVKQTLADKGYVVYYELGHGAQGEDVLNLQMRLTDLGYYTGMLNGKYNSETQKAVKQFQKNNHLPVDGIATVETQILLFSDQASGGTTPVPKATATPKPTLDPVYSQYEQFDYTEAARYPENYVGKRVALVGRVVQVIGTRESGFTIRFATSGYSDIVYVSVPSDLELSFNILENDSLTIYAVMRGMKTYTSTMSVSITVPYALAEHVILR